MKKLLLILLLALGCASQTVTPSRTDLGIAAGLYPAKGCMVLITSKGNYAIGYWDAINIKPGQHLHGKMTPKLVSVDIDRINFVENVNEND